MKQETLSLVELNSILKILRESALDGGPCKKGVETVMLAKKVIKVMQSIVDTLPEDVQKMLKVKEENET